MSRKVKVNDLKKVTGDINLNGMFEEMLGVADAEPTIVAPKFVQARNIVRRLTKVLAQFGTMPTLRRNHPVIIPHLDQIKEFADRTREELHIKTDSDELPGHYDTLTKEEINRVYRKLKENPSTKRLIIMCNRLEPHKLNFENPEKLRENFVNAEPGLDFKIFDFSNLDLKYLWGVCEIPSSAKRYILALFADLYKHSHALYNLITSPDVDIKAFTEALITSLTDLKKQPKLSRCKRAFKRIEMSVDLLNDRFTDYYRESVVTQNPDTLVGNFIYDVSQQGKEDPKLMYEFKQIINFMREMSERNGKANDPKVKQIFAMLQENFNLMDRRAPGFNDVPAAAAEPAEPSKPTEPAEPSEPTEPTEQDLKMAAAAKEICLHIEPEPLDLSETDQSSQLDGHEQHDQDDGLSETDQSSQLDGQSDGQGDQGDQDQQGYCSE
jgi:hypothetical protein